MTEGVREEEKEEEKDGWGTNEEEKKKDFLTLQLLPRQRSRQYIALMPQWHKGIK